MKLTLEVVNKNSGNNLNAIMMPYLKFVQCGAGGMLTNAPSISGRRKIKGTFKEKKTGRVIENDIFYAYAFDKEDVEICYKVALAWFNKHATRIGNEDEREFVKAEWLGTTISIEDYSKKIHRR